MMTPWYNASWKQRTFPEVNWGPVFQSQYIWNVQNHQMSRNETLLRSLKSIWSKNVSEPTYKSCPVNVYLENSRNYCLTLNVMHQHMSALWTRKLALLSWLKKKVLYFQRISVETDVVPTYPPRCLAQNVACRIAADWIWKADLDW